MTPRSKLVGQQNDSITLVSSDATTQIASALSIQIKFKHGHTDTKLAPSFVRPAEDEFMYFYVNHFVNHDMFICFHGGGVSHQVTREWDEFLRNDGAVVSVNDDEDLEFELGEVGDNNNEDDSKDDGDKDNDGEDVREDRIDDEDHIRADEGEELDDDILTQEGYGAL
ncbi:hypothetical protein BDR03DRAFT_1017791 [Suillus americanus]|nr:hypothetical protein BDR03DRAFT_1017791 [Suillus americanus]